jgi:uncharacterized damage-inducible protein DinB
MACYHPPIQHSRRPTITNFESDREALLADIAAARDELLRTVRSLEPGDLARGRRGGWTITRILEHVIQSERLYAQAVSALTGTPVPAPDTASDPQTSDEALAALDTTRSAVLAAVENATEDNFYDIRTFGHDEYSVLSVLENVANHDREHAEQIAKTLEAL